MNNRGEIAPLRESADATASSIEDRARLEHMGIIKMPNFSGSDSKYRPCLQEFYADWAPEKLGTLDDTLIKWEGRVRRQWVPMELRNVAGVRIARWRMVPDGPSA